MTERQIGIALTGASGAAYFLRLIERLKPREDVHLHVVVSDGGRRVLVEEEGRTFDSLKLSGVTLHKNKDIAASMASGSFPLEALVVVPCSQNTLCSIAAGLSSNLVTRAAAVQLKERRKLILVTRETPLSLIAIRAMATVTEAGGIIMPASPGFYHKPETITDLVDSIVDRVIDHLNLLDNSIKRWKS